MIVARNLLLSALCLVAASARAGTYSVTSAADSGPGSLRQAILDANSGACAPPCRIQYGSVAGVLTVAPLTELPGIDASNVSITSQPQFRSWTLEISGANLSAGSGLRIRGSFVTVSGVIINGFPGTGIVVEGTNDQIGSCIIGLDATGTRAVPNRQNGITIGGARGTVLDSNTIGGNGGNGVFASNASDLLFGGNTIGKQYLPQGSGNISLPNGATGVFLQNVQGARFLRNTIVNNALDGIATSGVCSGIAIEHDSLPTVIYNNGLMPIDLGFDGVTPAGRPVLTTADVSNGFMRVVGHASSLATINIFAGDRINAYGIADAKTSLYAGKSNAAGAFEFRFSLSINGARPIDPAGLWISATATTDTTSELSDPLRVVENDQNFTVTNANDSEAGSLRQAILDANAGICSEDFPCRVQLSGQTVTPLSALPPITRSGIIIDGGNTGKIDGSLAPAGPGLTISSANAALLADSIRGLTITNFNGPGILIDAPANSILNPLIMNNTITSNRGDGILVRGNVPFVHNGTYRSGNQIARNTINGNAGNGVKLEGGFFELDTNTIENNGASGVDIEAAAGGHLEGNTLAFNRDAGLSVVTTVPEAFKAAIANIMHSNVGPAIRQSVVVQEPPRLTSATYDPATQITTITGTVTRAKTTWTTTVDLYSTRFPEVDGRGSGEKVIFEQTVPNGAFSVSFKLGDLRGMRISATATPFSYQGFKGTPDPDLFGQGYEYGTTSEFSRAIPVTTIGCSADLPQIVSSSATELRWMTVAGATSYNVWLRSVPGTPQIIGMTSADRLTVALGSGTYEWFVEAAFPQCPPMKSEAARVVVPRRRVFRD